MTPDDLLARIDEAQPLQQDGRRAAEFMLQICDALAHRLPDVGTRALGTARRYHAGSASKEELEAARLECWRYIRQQEAASSADAPNARATRAIICLLDPAPPDVFELTHFFISIVRTIASSEDLLVETLSRVFKDVIQRLGIERAVASQGSPYRKGD